MTMSPRSLDRTRAGCVNFQFDATGRRASVSSVGSRTLRLKR